MSHDGHLCSTFEVGDDVTLVTTTQEEWQMSNENPWVSAAADESPLPAAWFSPVPAEPSEDHSDQGVSQPEETYTPPGVTGPTVPQRGVQPPEVLLPVRAVTAGPALWVVGAHGGAGESTIAAMDDGWSAAEHAWPSLEGGAPAVCLLVARTHVSGLLAAQRALTQWASSSAGPSAQCVGLLLLADRPEKKTPKAITDLISHVAGGAPRLWRIDWVEDWRLGDVDARPPRSVAKVLRDLHGLSPAPAGDDSSERKLGHDGSDQSRAHAS